MDREKAFAWADRLDSGEEIQGYSALEYTQEGKSETRRCCLGVAARMCDLTEDRIQLTQGCDRVETVFDGNVGTLSEKLQKELGMHSDDGRISIKDREGYAHWSLANFNDHGFTFPQIADLIRHFYKEL